MDLESVAAELYAGERAEFVALRDARARQARDAGDDALARSIRALRKPSVAAALLNRVAREHPAEITRLLDLNAELLSAHTTLAGAALRALSRQRRELIGEILDLARATARAAGAAVSDPVARQIQQTAEAAGLDRAGAAALRAGRLSEALESGDAQQWFAMAAASSRPETLAAQENPPVAKRGSAAGRAAARQRELDRARARADATERARLVAADALAQAEQRVNDAAAEVTARRARLDDAIRTERDLAEQARTARAALQRADRAAVAAQRRVHDLFDEPTP